MLELMLWQWIALVGVLLFACFVQGAVGFAAGLISISLSLLIGIPLPEAIILSMIASLVQCMGGVWNLRGEAGGQHLWLPIVCRLIWMPIGVYLLWKMDRSWDPERIKQLIGVVVLVGVVILSLSRVPQVERLPTWSTVLAFSVSGLMHGALGMAGPPVVLWLSLLSWSSQKNRVFLFQLFLASIPLQAVILWWTYPDRFWPAVLAGVLMIPAMLLGSSGGLWLGNRLDRHRLRRWSLALLALIAAVSILNPWLNPRQGAASTDAPQEAGARNRPAGYPHVSRSGQL